MCPRSAVGTVRSSQPESMDRATAGRTTYSVQGKPRTGSASGEDNPAQIRNEQSLWVFPLDTPTPEIGWCCPRLPWATPPAACPRVPLWGAQGCQLTAQTFASYSHWPEVGRLSSTAAQRWRGVVWQTTNIEQRCCEVLSGSDRSSSDGVEGEEGQEKEEVGEGGAG